MPVAIWDSSFVTGNALVDQQHQHLFALVNNLHDHIVAGKGREVLAPSLDQLAKYTIEHFQAEEALMQARHYPGLAGHRSKHHELLAKANTIINDYRSGKSVLAISLSHFLSDWLRHHIHGEDKVMVEWMRNHPK